MYHKINPNKINDGNIKLDPLIMSGMILQSNTKILITGTLFHDDTIYIQIDNKLYKRKSKNKIFKIKINSFPPGGPYDLFIFSKTSFIHIKDVLFGKVFLMGGQSNMAITFNDLFKSMPEEESKRVKKLLSKNNNHEIRYFRIPTKSSKNQLSNFDNINQFGWMNIHKDYNANLSATSFYFAIRIYELLKIPIGIIDSSVGATITATWISSKYTKNMDKTYVTNINDEHKLSMFFNGMIYPIKNYKINAVIWYQGEGQHINYYDNTKRLIKSWRNNFKSRNLHFHIISLPRINYDLNYTQDSWFLVREQQKTLSNYKNVSLSVNIDLGLKETETTDPMHPYDKESIGKRAAESYFKYHFKTNEILSSPILRKTKVTSEYIYLIYENVGEKLKLKFENLGFEGSENSIDFEKLKPILHDKHIIKFNVSNRKYQILRYAYSYNFGEYTDNYNGFKGLITVFNSGNYPANQFYINLVKNRKK